MNLMIVKRGVDARDKRHSNPNNLFLLHKGFGSEGVCFLPETRREESEVILPLVVPAVSPQTTREDQ